MSRHYSASTIFRCVSNELLKEYFKSHNALNDFNFSELKKNNHSNISYLQSLFNCIEEKLRIKIEVELREIFGYQLKPGQK